LPAPPLPQEATTTGPLPDALGLGYDDGAWLTHLEAEAQGIVALAEEAAEDAGRAALVAHIAAQAAALASQAVALARAQRRDDANALLQEAERIREALERDEVPVLHVPPLVALSSPPREDGSAPLPGRYKERVLGLLRRGRNYVDGLRGPDRLRFFLLVGLVVFAVVLLGLFSLLQC